MAGTTAYFNEIVVQLIGGPKDGLELKVPAYCRALYFGLANSECTDKTRQRGIYERGQANRMFWAGYENRGHDGPTG